MLHRVFTLQFKQIHCQIYCILSFLLDLVFQVKDIPFQFNELSGSSPVYTSQNLKKKIVPSSINLSSEMVKLYLNFKFKLCNAIKKKSNVCHHSFVPTDLSLFIDTVAWTDKQKAQKVFSPPVCICTTFKIIVLVIKLRFVFSFSICTTVCATLEINKK